MRQPIDYLLRQQPKPFLNFSEFSLLLSGSADSRYSKIKRLLAEGTLLHLRRGLYVMSDKVGHTQKTNPFELAQHLYAPSYISLESALAYHGLIPEAVYSITSVSSKLPKQFETPLGLFTYARLPLLGFYTGVIQVQENNATFFIASPWKAICDYVYCYKKNWRNKKPLIESLRMQHDDIPLLSQTENEMLQEYYQHNRLTAFLKGIAHEY